MMTDNQTCDDLIGRALIPPFQFNDGGRAAAGISGDSGDCVVRAIAIATGKPYLEVCSALQNGLRHQIAIERREELEFGMARRTKPKATPLTGLTSPQGRPGDHGDSSRTPHDAVARRSSDAAHPSAGEHGPACAIGDAGAFFKLGKGVTR